MINKIQAAMLYAYGYKLQDKEGCVYQILASTTNFFEVQNIRFKTIKDNFYFEDIGTDYKILARPLEQLTQLITHEGKTFVPIKRLLWEYNFDTDIMQESEILEYSESMIEIDISATVRDLLYEWNFQCIEGIRQEFYINLNT